MTGVTQRCRPGPWHGIKSAPNPRHPCTALELTLSVMAYDQALENRINQMWINEFPDASPKITVKKMFGGLAYLYRGKMTLGIVGDSLMARVVSPEFEKVLEEDAVRPMDFTGRPMKEFVFIDPEGFETAEALARWARLGLEHAVRQLAKTGSPASE